MLPNNSDQPVAVYVHIPFCPTKCGYCDFNSYAMEGEIVERTVNAISREIRESPIAGRPAKTIFFGGGTPTFLAEEQLVGIFEEVLRVHPPILGAEITSEANPGTVDIPKFRAMHQAGFNRISLGAQSFQDTDLIRLGRIHQSGEIERAVNAAREAGFENVNLDLMFALPDQSLHGWRKNLDRALALKPEHLSLYCLTIEQNTAYYKLNLRGQLNLPDDDQQVAMYEECINRCTEEGYGQYEISNFSKPGRKCLHNLCYWAGEEYAGYGPGAVGALDLIDRRIRYTNLKHPDGYCAAVEAGKATAFDVETLDVASLRVEKIMLGLRMNEGLCITGLELAPLALEKLQSRRWVEIDNDLLRLTEAGRHFCSEVALELI